MGFVAHFVRFPITVQNFENRLRFDKVAESLKVKTFLRHSVHLLYHALKYADTVVRIMSRDLVTLTRCDIIAQLWPIDRATSRQF